MSVPQSSSDVSGVGSSQFYLLQMDPKLCLKADEQNIFPLHILNTIPDYNQQHKQLTDNEEQVQHELLIDSCSESVKLVIKQEDKNRQQDDKLPIQHYILAPSLPSYGHSKNLSIKEIESSLIAPSQGNLSEQEGTYFKKKEIQNYVHIADRSILPRAFAVLPTALQLRRQNVILPRRILPPRTRFGPIQGVKHKVASSEINKLVMTSAANKTPLFVLRGEDEYENLTLIDVSDKDKANWIGLLPLGDDTTANVWIYEEGNELYIITTDAIPLRKQLMLGYSAKYARDYGLVGPTKDIQSESPIQKSWWCYECQRSMSSAALLQRHMEINHQDDGPPGRRRYRCRHCTRTFCRIFTLRRHMARHCEKKPSKSDTIASTETQPESSLNSSFNTDDNRVPSDESFQNYSNGLDFSTNLFDTDRMPSLYMSGNSRSEVFNPYGLDSENPLTSDLGYVNGCSNKTDTSLVTDNQNLLQDKNTEPTVVQCPYCKQDVASGLKRQHINKCPARRFECECKKTFTNKEQLALHIYTEHSIGKAAEEESEKEGSDKLSTKPAQNPTPFTCEQCQHSFKRRGMLVNHLWRVHKMSAARVPMDRRVRYYPCAACPKIYRTATKRDRHVSVHHPGIEKIRMAPLEGGTRPCSPAACQACPRQYATRAKLLQHLRLRHPHLVPPPAKKILAQKSSNANDKLKASEELLRNKASLQQLLTFY